MTKRSHRKPGASAATPPPPPPSDGWSRGVLWVLLAVAAALLLATLLQSGASPHTPDLAGKPWAAYAPVIARNKLIALLHASILTALLAGAWARATGLLGKPAWLTAPRIAWGLVLLVAADALWLSRHYIATTPRAGLADNAALRAIRETAPQGRVALGTREGFYNLWLTYLFPYHGISAFDMTQMPRMPADYREFLGRVGSDPYRMWRLCGVEALMLPQGVWASMQRDPRWRGKVEPVLFFDAQPQETYVSVEAAPFGRMGAHGIFRLGPGPARFVLVHDWRTGTAEEALAALGQPGFEPLRTVLVTGGAVPPPPVAAGPTGTVEVLSYRQGAVSLRVENGTAAMLRFADRYDPNWRAWVDGAPADLLRVDYLFQGLYLLPGTHTVELRYTAPLRGLWIQLAGTAMALLGALALLVRRGRGPVGATPG